MGSFGLSKTNIVSIIDDDASVRAGMEALVNSIGFKACVFDSAEKFLRSSRIEDTSCLVTDVQMPGMNGLDLQGQLVAQGRRIPIIFITAFPEQKGRERALAAGAFAYLEKPFAGETMTGLLRKAMDAPSACG